MDDASNGNTVPSGTTAPADTTPAATTATTPPSTDETANPSKQDWAQFKKDQRDLLGNIKALVDAIKAPTAPGRTAEVKPAAAPAPSTPSTSADAGVVERLAAMERKAELGGVYADFGIKAGPQRDFIELATRSMPPEGIRGFVDGYLKTIPAPTAAAPAAPVAKPVTPPIATGGAAAGASPQTDPGDLANVDPAVLASLPREERMKRYELFRSRGPNTNPYAGEKTRRVLSTGRK